MTPAADASARSRALTSRVLRSTTFQNAVACIQIPALLAVLPFLWFPQPWSGLLLLVVPAFWGFRWLTQGRFSIRTPYDRPLVGLILCVPLFLLPIVDWDAALPKLYGLALGVAFAYATANLAVVLGKPRRLAILVFLGLCVGLLFIALFAMERPPQKLLAVQQIVGSVPLLVGGVIKGTERGAVHFNEVAGLIALATPAVLAVWLHRATRPGVTNSSEGKDLPALLLLSALTVGGFGLGFSLLLTQSRSGLIGVLAGCLIVLLGWADRHWNQWSRRSHTWFVAAALAALIGAAWATGSLVMAWTGEPAEKLDSFVSRVEIWEHAALMIYDFPVTGIGMGQFSRLFHELYPSAYIHESIPVPHAHNFFLQLALDLGIPGAATIVGMLAGFARALWQVWRGPTDEESSSIALGLLAGIAAYLVYGLTDAIAIGARGGLGFWLFLGLGAGLAAVNQPRTDRPQTGSSAHL